MGLMGLLRWGNKRGESGGGGGDGGGGRAVFVRCCGRVGRGLYTWSDGHGNTRTVGVPICFVFLFLFFSVV